MDFIALATTWFWYVMAFGAGMLVAWLLARQFVPARDPREAIDRAVSELRGGASDHDDTGEPTEPAASTAAGSTAAGVHP